MTEISTSRDIEAIAASQKNKERDYWMNKLAGDLEVSSFPYDYHYNDKKFMETVGFCFSNDVSDRIIKISNRSEPRLFVILLTGLVALINKYTGSSDIILGAPIINQGISGKLINTLLPLRVQFDSNISFKELLLKVRETIRQATENQNYPIKTLLYHLNLSASEDVFPLFDIVALLENIHTNKYLQDIPTTITLTFSRTDTSVKGLLEYNGAKYYKNTIKRIVSHFQSLLESSIFEVEQQVCDIDILSQDEKEQLLFAFNCTDVEYDGIRLVHRLFEEQEERTPNHTAVFQGDYQMTYRELNEKANQLAHRLRSTGVNPDRPVAVIGKVSAPIVTAILAILKAGGAYLPIDINYPTERQKYIYEDSEAELVLASQATINEGMVASFAVPREAVIPFDDEREYYGFATNPELVNKPEDLAYIIYTSGTTGKPKGVMIEQRGFFNYINWAAQYYVRGETVDFPLYTSISFDLTVTSIFTPLVTGNAIAVYSEDLNELSIQKIIEENQVGVVKLTPSHLKLIRRMRKGQPTSSRESSPGGIKRFIVGGEELETVLATDIYKLFAGNIEIYNEYGPTETVVGSMVHKFESEKEKNTGRSVLIGKPIANTRIYILDQHQKPVPFGVTGELCISGDGVARGYLKRDALTAEKFLENPFIKGEQLYRTGDLARRLPDGNIEFLGRMDEQVKIRGFRIELGEIENHLFMHPDIKEALVVAKEFNKNTDSDDESREKFLCAYIVTGNELEVSGLRNYLLESLPDYMVPSYFVTLNKIPLNLNGKVDMKALPEPEAGVGVEMYTAPRNTIEIQLVRIWSEVLRIEEKRIGIDANFFAIGGHSLNATLMTAKVHKELNVDLPLVEIFKTPTIRGLSKYIKGITEDNYMSIEPAEKKEYYPLSSGQKQLYILQQMDGGGISYNSLASVLLEGNLDKKMLEHTFRWLIERHESLRTSFEMIDGEPVQKIHMDVEFKIEYFVIKEVEVKEDEETRGLAPLSMDLATRNSQPVTDLIKSFIRPFDLSQTPLLRVGLIRIPPPFEFPSQEGNFEDRYILLVDMHHIISDGVSMGLLVREFMAFYSGKALPEPGIRITYKDFSEWQNSKEVRESINQQEKYWLQQFKGEIPILNIPTDYSRPVIQNYEGSSIDFEISVEETRALNELALSEGATLFMLLVAVYNIFLSKLSGQEDIIIGIPLARRNHADLENIIGMFVNTLPLRNYPTAEKTFSEFLIEVKKRTLQAVDNQDYSFEALVDKLKVNRDVKRNPLFDVTFQLENIDDTDIPEIEIAGVLFRSYKVESEVSRFALRMLAFEMADSLHFKVEYFTALFNRETIERFISYFKEIVSCVLENKDIKLQDISLSHDLIDGVSDFKTEDYTDFKF